MILFLLNELLYQSYKTKSTIGCWSGISGYHESIALQLIESGIFYDSPSKDRLKFVWDVQKKYKH